MLQTIRVSAAVCFLLFQITAAVDIGSFEEIGCDDWGWLNARCQEHPERICCGFPQRLTGTWSVGFRGLSEGDIATWFHEGPSTPVPATPQNPHPNPIRNHCGGIRRSQVMMGSHSGVICMDAPAEGPHESNDGANW